MEPVGITGSAPGLTGATKVVADRLEYTVGERFGYKKPKVPFPRLKWTDAALKFNLRWSLDIFFVVWGSADWIDRLKRGSFHNFIDLGGHADGVFFCF